MKKTFSFDAKQQSINQTKLTVELVPTTTNVVSLNHTYGDVYSMQHYWIKFVSDLRQVGGVLGYSGFLHQ